MSLAPVFDSLGQEVIPAIALAVFPDKGHVYRDIQTSDGAGGQVSSDNDNNLLYYDVPIKYAAQRRYPSKEQSANQLVSTVNYLVQMPTHHQGERIVLKPWDRIRCLERGGEPEKTFRIRGIENAQGVIFKMDCDLENET